ncbi:MAG: hypothetical protein Kow0010_27650 [Dehalococcoidia bacterium]
MRNDAFPADSPLDQVVDFPTISPDAWLAPQRPLSWPEAILALGVTRSQLRRALDRARRAAGPHPLAVEGVCNGVRFRAVRPVSRRGVAWRFAVLHNAAAPEGRLADLRVAIQRHKSLPDVHPRSFRDWLRRAVTRLRSA